MLSTFRVPSKCEGREHHRFLFSGNSLEDDEFIGGPKGNPWYTLFPALHFLRILCIAMQQQTLQVLGSPRRSYFPGRIIVNSRRSYEILGIPGLERLLPGKEGVSGSRCRPLLRCQIEAEAGSSPSLGEPWNTLYQIYEGSNFDPYPGF